MVSTNVKHLGRISTAACLTWIAVSFLGAISCHGDDSLLDLGWKSNGFATQLFEINGTEGRNNPLRRQLKQPFTGDELFVRYRIRYAADSVDTPLDDEGEFVVLWLDEVEGNDASTHTGGVPNVGIHVSGNHNRFMVRYASSNEKTAAQLVGGRDFVVVARLWKSRSGANQPFDQLNLWVDPKSTAEFKPDASVESSKAIAKVSWIGFSTGAKTEVEDRVFVSNVELKTTWRGILGLSKQAPATPAIVDRTVDFDEHVYPILTAKCFSCHAGNDADVRLDVHDEVLNYCLPGNAVGSHLFQLVAKEEMPPQGEPRISKTELATLRTWVDEGLVWNDQRLPAPRPQSDHWSFQKIVRPAVPEVASGDWIRTPVDAFVARKQEMLGVTPAPAAEAQVLARRMSLDMLGLPPSKAVPAKAVANVEGLLRNPAYGQRWARHWLDVARWAESNGHQHNRARPHAWRYRDWVVDALNHDLPFDQFLVAQIAGDELPAVASGDDSRLIATGFLAAARYSGNELDKRIQRNDILVDVVNTTASAFLGLTLQCAQCHSHKFDPLSMRDYYRMQAFFVKGQPANISLSESDQAKSLIAERWGLFDRTFQRLVRVRERKGDPNPRLVTPKTVVAKIAGAEKQRFTELNRRIGELDQTWGFYAPSTAAEQRLITPHEMRWPLPQDPEILSDLQVRMLLRGDINTPGPEVGPGWPLVFGDTGKLGDQPRILLAKWMTSKQNPLTARVWVNRIWCWHFGKGLVETLNDFGTQGATPTHPELLDWLASELMDHGWSTNHIHRLILNSATYRQSSRFSEANAALDPANTTYWRWMPRRLEAEAIRDSMLAVAGQLDRTLGGPSVSDQDASNRRSLYLSQRRERLPNQQVLFDSADGVVSCPRRRTSTNALQPLWLLNSPFSHSAAAALAKRAGTVDAAFTICLGRSPTDDEMRALEGQAEKHGLASACLVLLNSSEFLYMP